MTQKIIYILWAVALMITACGQQEPPYPSSCDATSLTFTITDGGFLESTKGEGSNPGSSLTRAEENGYRTDFTAGDACGLYIVRDGMVVYENIKLTAAVAHNGKTIIWRPATSVEGWTSADSYFLYYPYQENMNNKTTAAAEDAEAFFAPLINGWEPKADQSTYEAYSASDLMTAKGMAKEADGSVSLSFSMVHHMAMAVIEMPKHIYRITSPTGAPIPDYIVADSVDFSDSDMKPFCISPGTYRCIMNPATSEGISLSGIYDKGKEFIFSPSKIAAGNYMLYKIDKAGPVEFNHKLQAGDFYCSKEVDGKTIGYVVPQTAIADLHKNKCIGLVFYAGHHASDNADYSATGIGQKECRGYVVALTDVNNGTSDRCAWCDGNVVSWGHYPASMIGTSDKSDDWEAYNNSLIIHDRIRTDTIKSEMKCYPAALACETYGNRTLDRDGNPTTDYDWQKPLVAPDNTSGWLLPSCGQLTNIYENREILSSRMTDAKDNTPDAASYKDHIRWFFTGDISRYWTSSESNWYIFCAWCVRFSNGYVANNYIKQGKMSVRPILVF